MHIPKILCNFADNLKEMSMKATISLDGLWEFLQSLSLSTNNKKWLADKLIESSQEDQLAMQKAREEQFVKDSFQRAWTELQSANKEGKSLPDARNLIAELQAV